MEHRILQSQGPHFSPVGLCQTEAKVGWEAVLVTFDGLIEAEGGYSVDAGEVGIQQHLLASYRDNQRVNVRHRMSGSALGHARVRVSGRGILSSSESRSQASRIPRIVAQGHFSPL